MDLKAPVLTGSLEDEFEDCQVEADGDDCVIITDSFAAGMAHPEDFEAFKQQVRQFVLQYTEVWDVDSFNHNRIEGYHQAVLRRES